MTQHLISSASQESILRASEYGHEYDADKDYGWGLVPAFNLDTYFSKANCQVLHSIFQHFEEIPVNSIEL
jgi:hypothetical protein